MICFDSRQVKKGDTFVAIKGLNVDGHDYIEEAIKKGAKTIVSEKRVVKKRGVKYVFVNDSQKKLGELASEFYKHPSKKLKIIGVTGTDGKTTTSHLIYSILKTDGKKVGLISTISARIGKKEYDTGFHVTNPDPISLNRFLSKMVEEKCTHAVLEVTSHGIDQKRIYGIEFDTTVITNITSEHLDYHKTFDEYRKVKISFLKSAKSNAVINNDDKSALVIEKSIPAKIRRIKYSLSKKSDFMAKNIFDAEKGLEFNLISGKDNFRIISNLHGKYNVSNILAAIAVSKAYGTKTTAIKKALNAFLSPAGRLEEIKNDKGFRIFVDFAHTSNALLNILTYLKSVKHKRLISVFGCAGERDKLKRFRMGRISGDLADLSILTAEDPRSEDVNKIIAKMVQGARKSGAAEITNKEIPSNGKHHFIRIPERGEAIAYCLSVAKKGDIVVIAGKGHERSMAYLNYEHPWSDQEKIDEFFKRRLDIAVVILAAGRGTRMKSSYPKILHNICGRPMISYTLENLRKAGLSKITAVVSYRKNLIIDKIKGDIKFAFQKNPKGGTADAVKSGLENIDHTVKMVIAINGDDSAFYKPETIREIISQHQESCNVLTFVTLEVENPYGLGRIVRDSRGKILGIIEEKDATEEQRKIKEVNDGLYVFDYKWLLKNIDKVKKGPQGEYYLVDLIKIAVNGKEKIDTYKLKNANEWHGINSPEQLIEANLLMKKRLLNNA